MAGLLIEERRGILLREAVMRLPEKFRKSHVPYRVNLKRSLWDDVIVGTVTFQAVSNSMGSREEYLEEVSSSDTLTKTVASLAASFLPPRIVTAELKVAIDPGEDDDVVGNFTTECEWKEG